MSQKGVRVGGKPKQFPVTKLILFPTELARAIQSRANEQHSGVFSEAVRALLVRQLESEQPKKDKP
jgi:hypothetical protein